MVYDNNNKSNWLNNWLTSVTNSNTYKHILGIYNDVINPGLNQELSWQKENSAAQLDFANRQLQENIRIANQNYDLQNNAFIYQQFLNEQQRLREDTAIQRQMADAQAAGLSPFSVMNGSGASSSPLSSPSAPQYDISGINQASGNYIDIAKQYAQLHMQAYNSSSSQRVNQRLQLASLRQGAKIALKQMENQLLISNNQLDFQKQQFEEQKKQFDKNNELANKELRLKTLESDWMEKHGYRNQDIQSYLIGVISTFVEKRLSNKAKEKIESMKQEIKDIREGKYYTEDTKKVLNEEIEKKVKDTVSESYFGTEYDKLSEKDKAEADTLANIYIYMP